MARGFLPSEYQGVPFNSSETDPEKMIRDLRNKQLDPQAQRKQLDLVQAMNRDYSASFGADSFLDGRLKAMESAYRVQFEAMDVFDVRKESEAIREEYGKNSWGTAACWPAGWSNAACATSTCIRQVRPIRSCGPTGTITRTSSLRCARAAPTWIRPRGLSVAI